MSNEIWDCIKKLRSNFTLKYNENDELYIICGICKNVMVEACQIMCGCRFCRECIHNHILSGGDHCPKNVSSDCSNVELLGMEDVHLERESYKIIMGLIVSCPVDGCDVEGELGNIFTHINECSAENSNTENKEKTTLQKRILFMEQNFENKMNELNRTIAALMEKVQFLESKTVSFEGHFGKMAEMAEEDWKNDFIWKIRNFSTKRQLGGRVDSDDFYLSRYGYKVTIYFFPNGVNGKDTHLSLYFQIMSGEYDDILTWPFKYDVVFSLLDQEGLGRHHTVTVGYSSDWEHIEVYQKPTAYRNKEYGIKKFISMDELSSKRHLIKDNILFVRCSFVKA